MPGNTWELIDKRQTALQPFYNQVDKTRSRLRLTEFELKDPLTGLKVPDAIVVTENKSATYMSRIVAGLLSAKWQTMVEGNIPKKQVRIIESFIEANFQQADEYLVSQYGLAGLNTWVVNHVCHTSLIGVQWMASVEKEDYRIHCLPLDMRWTPFVLNKWAAPITYRDKEDILEELEGYQELAAGEGGAEFEMPSELKDTDNEIRDYWDEKINELWVEKQQVFRQKNTYGKLPFVFVWAPSGFLFRDRGYLEFESPSLLALNEGLYDQLSRQLTIDATLGYNSLEPATEYETENPTGGKSVSVPRRGETLAVPKGELHRPVPSADINRAQLATRDEVSRLIDEASPMSPRAYNTPPSAIEVATEVELLDELQNPRIIALQTFKQELGRLMIDQFTTLKAKGKIGKTGFRKFFTSQDLPPPGDYTISYQMMKQNKRLAIVNEARALALWGRAPMKYLLRDVLGVEDPDGWQREMELEKAKAANPALALAEMAVRYAEEAEETEDETDKEMKNWQSMMLVHDYATLMRQRLQPAMPAEAQDIREATKETGNAQGLLSMLGKGGALPRLQGARAGEVVR